MLPLSFITRTCTRTRHRSISDNKMTSLSPSVLNGLTALATLYVCCDLYFGNQLLESMRYIAILLRNFFIIFVRHTHTHCCQCSNLALNQLSIISANQFIALTNLTSLYVLVKMREKNELVCCGCVNALMMHVYSNLCIHLKVSASMRVCVPTLRFVYFWTTKDFSSLAAA